MNSYLSKTIMTVVAALSIGASANAFASDSTTTEDTMTVTYNSGWFNSYDAYGYMIDYYDIWDDSNAGSQDNGGSSTPMDCNFLKATKPQDCANPKPYPMGADYGRDQMAGGAGIPKLLYFANHQNGTREGPRQLVNQALKNHTYDLASRWVTFDIANSYLLAAVSSACSEQRKEDTSLRINAAVASTPAERRAWKLWSASLLNLLTRISPLGL